MSPGSGRCHAGKEPEGCGQVTVETHGHSRQGSGIGLSEKMTSEGKSEKEPAQGNPGTVSQAEVNILYKNPGGRGPGDDELGVLQEQKEHARGWKSIREAEHWSTRSENSAVTRSGRASKTGRRSGCYSKHEGKPPVHRQGGHDTP